MLVKTFEGISMKEVIGRIKKEYGSDVVILSTKNKAIEGSSAKVFEVKAAVPETSQKAGASCQQQNQTSSSASFQAYDDKLESIDRRLNSLADKLATKQQYATLENGLKELKLICMNAMRTTPTGGRQGIPTHLESLYQQLHLMGVDEAYLVDLIKHLNASPSFEEAKKSDNSSADEYYRSLAIRYMFKKIKILPPIKPLPGQTQIHLFVGGSGVGKTCTIAKIASHYQNKEKAQVLLVSFDNKKVMAGDPLPVYSKILGINHVMIDEAEELEKVILKHRNCELVLIDCMGGIPKSDKDLKLLSSFMEKPLPIDVHLVLSLTENSRQMDRTITSFAPLGLHSIVFTKLDESWTYGEMYNSSCRWALPLSFFSVGQKIPEDFESASRERVIERLFGL